MGIEYDMDDGAVAVHKATCDMDEDCTCGAYTPFCVYVAGPSADLDRARIVVRELRVRGVAVIGDGWISSVERNGPDAKLPKSLLAECADDDLGAIRGARLVLVLTNDWGGVGTSGGATIEAGAALGLDIPVVTSGGPLHPLFRAKVTAECQHDAEAVELVAAIALGWTLGVGRPIGRYRVGKPKPYGDEPPEVSIDAEELPEAEPEEAPPAPRVVRPGDLLAALGESPEVAAARAAGRAAVSRGEP